MYILSSASRGGWPRIIEGNEHRGGNSRERGRGLGKGERRPNGRSGDSSRADPTAHVRRVSQAIDFSRSFSGHSGLQRLDGGVAELN